MQRKYLIVKMSRGTQLMLCRGDGGLCIATTTNNVVVEVNHFHEQKMRQLVFASAKHAHDWLKDHTAPEDVARLQMAGEIPMGKCEIVFEEIDGDQHVLVANAGGLRH